MFSERKEKAPVQSLAVFYGDFTMNKVADDIS